MYMCVHILFSISGACFSRINPLSIKNPRLVAHSQSALSLLGLPSSEAMRPARTCGIFQWK